MLRGLAVAIDVPKSPRGVRVQDDHQDKRGADEPDEGGPTIVSVSASISTIWLLRRVSASRSSCVLEYG
jgi:hypothetical protein